MELEDRLETPMGQLSGGQRQALTLLMATLVRPELLLLDEHTAALDPRMAEKVMRLTQRSIDREQLTTLMVTHALPQAIRYGDRVIMMHRGRIAMEFSGARQADAEGAGPAGSVRPAAGGGPAGRVGRGDAPPALRLGRDLSGP